MLLVGDDAQLSVVETGGAFRMLGGRLHGFGRYASLPEHPGDEQQTGRQDRRPTTTRQVASRLPVAARGHGGSDLAVSPGHGRAGRVRVWLLTSTRGLRLATTTGR
ncbi:MAG: hypothetical protein GEU93_07005 [Propionibacteriales bacterium]|nr:hypothetical protein [Propionibacteriales bacterium]